MALFHKYLPDKMLFAAIGNHESAPVNRYIIRAIMQVKIIYLCRDLHVSKPRHFMLTVHY